MFKNWLDSYKKVEEEIKQREKREQELLGEFHRRFTIQLDNVDSGLSISILLNGKQVGHIEGSVYWDDCFSFEIKEEGEQPDYGNLPYSQMDMIRMLIEKYPEK